MYPAAPVDDPEDLTFTRQRVAIIFSSCARNALFLRTCDKKITGRKVFFFILHARVCV